MPSSAYPYDSTIGTGQADTPIIPRELEDASFSKTDAGGIAWKFNPASNITLDRDPADGLKLTAPPPTMTMDILSKKMTVSYPGHPDQVIDLAYLDDEGIELRLVGQELQLFNGAGSLISSTPITDVDAQQLSSYFSGDTPDVFVLELTNGGGVKITCETIARLFAENPGSISPKAYLLGDDCQKHSVATLIAQAVAESILQNPPQVLQLIGGDLTAGVSFELSPSGGIVSLNPLTCTDVNGLYPVGQAPTLTTPVLTRACASYTVGSILGLTTVSNTITGNNLTTTVNGVTSAPVTLPAQATTNTQTWTKASGLIDIVNGTSAATSIPAVTAFVPQLGVTDLLVYDTTNGPKHWPISRWMRFNKRVLSDQAANTTVTLTFPAVNSIGTTTSGGPTITAPQSHPLFDLTSLSTNIPVAGTGVTVVLPTIPANERAEFSGTDYAIVLAAGWTGSTTLSVVAPATLNGTATTLTLNKPVATERITFLVRYMGAGAGVSNTWWVISKYVQSNATTL